MSYFGKSCQESSRVVFSSAKESDGENDHSLAGRIVERTSETNSASKIAPLSRNYGSSFQTSLRIKGIKLHDCTEALGSESSGDQEDSSTAYQSASSDVSVRAHVKEFGRQIKENGEGAAFNQQALSSSHPVAPMSNVHKGGYCESVEENSYCEFKTTKYKGKFPPPLASIARAGSPHSSENAPRVFLRPYKGDGRFVLQEVSVGGRCRDFLRASRKDGRLRLELVHHDDGHDLGSPSAPEDSSSAGSRDLEYQEKVHDGLKAETARIIPACSTGGTASTGSSKPDQMVQMKFVESMVGKHDLQDDTSYLKPQIATQKFSRTVAEKQTGFTGSDQTYDPLAMSSIDFRTCKKHLEFHDSFRSLLKSSRLVDLI